VYHTYGYDIGLAKAKDSAGSSANFDKDKEYVFNCSGQMCKSKVSVTTETTFITTCNLNQVSLYNYI
jgi:hypothetical protein